MKGEPRLSRKENHPHGAEIFERMNVEDRTLTRQTNHEATHPGEAGQDFLPGLFFEKKQLCGFGSVCKL